MSPKQPVQQKLRNGNTLFVYKGLTPDQMVPIMPATLLDRRQTEQRLGSAFAGARIIGDMALGVPRIPERTSHLYLVDTTLTRIGAPALTLVNKNYNPRNPNAAAHVLPIEENQRFVIGREGSDSVPEAFAAALAADDYVSRDHVEISSLVLPTGDNIVAVTGLNVTNTTHLRYAHRR